MEAKFVEHDFVGGEVAALLMMFLRVGKSSATPFTDFREQLDTCKRIGSGTPFGTAFEAIDSLYQDKPYLFDAAHQSIRSVLMELAKAQRWGGCGFVTQDQISEICALN
jgi:hypothetical protein